MCCVWDAFCSTKQQFTATNDLIRLDDYHLQKLNLDNNQHSARALIKKMEERSKKETKRQNSYPGKSETHFSF